jgi:pyridoxal phosphate enzyme (YggS family)
MSIAERIEALKTALPQGVTLVAVSKFQPVEAICAAYAAGQRVFAESRAAELREKYEALPKDIEWHFIGTMQTNKVKIYAPFVTMIQSVDSRKALDIIQKEALKNDRTIDVLLEVHIAEEASKSGFSPAEAEAYLACGHFRELTNVRLRGLMGMATFTDDRTQSLREFSVLASLFERLKAGKERVPSDFDTLSMGMTDDWPAAVAADSTMVRIGSYIFGTRIG